MRELPTPTLDLSPIALPRGSLHPRDTADVGGPFASVAQPPVAAGGRSTLTRFAKPNA
jgi:hypothetical protein